MLNASQELDGQENIVKDYVVGCQDKIVIVYHNLVPRALSLSWVRGAQDREKALGTRLCISVLEIEQEWSRKRESCGNTRRGWVLAQLFWVLTIHS